MTDIEQYSKLEKWRKNPQVVPGRLKKTQGVEL